MFLGAAASNAVKLDENNVEDFQVMIYDLLQFVVFFFSPPLALKSPAHATAPKTSLFQLKMS